MRIQPAVAVTVAVIVATTLLSGPALSVVDLTADDAFQGADLGDGRLTVGDVTLAETVTIERGDFGAGSFYLQVPASTVELTDVQGRPILSYQVSVDGLGFTRSSVHVLSSADEGSYELSIEEVAFGKNEIHNGSYAGELSITARYDDSERVLERRNLTIEVRE